MKQTREVIHNLIKDNKNCYTISLNNIKEKLNIHNDDDDSKQYQLYINDNNNSLTEYFYRDIIIVRNNDSNITKNIINTINSDFVNAINTINLFSNYSKFLNSFNSLSNDIGHELIRTWIKKYINCYSFHRPINNDSILQRLTTTTTSTTTTTTNNNTSSSTSSNNEMILTINILPDELLSSSYDTFFILLNLSKDIHTNVITKKIRISIINELKNDDSNRKKGIKRCHDSNNNDHDNSNNNSNNNINSINTTIITNITNINATITTTTSSDTSNDYVVNKKTKTVPTKLLVFDLNGVLIYKKKRTKSKTFIIRPYAKEFIELMSERYQLAVWTSRNYDTAQPIVRALFPLNNLLFTWYHDKCDMLRDNYDDNGNPIIIYIKDLDKVWKQYHEYNDTNTILLDDSIEKCSMNKYYNCIHPQSFIVSHLKNNTSKESNDNDNELHKDNKLFIYLDDLSKHDGSIYTYMYNNNHYNDDIYKIDI